MDFSLLVNRRQTATVRRDGQADDRLGGILQHTVLLQPVIQLAQIQGRVLLRILPEGHLDGHPADGYQVGPRYTGESADAGGHLRRFTSLDRSLGPSPDLHPAAHANPRGVTTTDDKTFAV